MRLRLSACWISMKSESIIHNVRTQILQFFVYILLNFTAYLLANHYILLLKITAKLKFKSKYYFCYYILI